MIGFECVSDEWHCSGFLIALAAALYSTPIAASLLLGSFWGFVVGVALGATGLELQLGLWGFNPALSAAALFDAFVVVSLKSFVLSQLSAVFTAIVFAALVTLFSPYSVPVLTFPFCVGSLLVLAGRKAIPGQIVLTCVPPMPPRQHAHTSEACCFVQGLMTSSKMLLRLRPRSPTAAR